MSEMMDPEDLRDVISSYQETCKQLVNRYGGYIARYMGDGLLIYFGYPFASDRDPERAVRTGLDIVNEIGDKTSPDGTPLSVRVGIATGRVVVGDLIGEGASEERAVLGDTPNLAARLQALAKPGTVCAAEATYALLSKTLNFEYLGLQSLKGITEDVHAYRALGENIIQTQPDKTTKSFFVGRKAELDILKIQWQHSSAGRGRVVTLTGEPGFGKSRLIAAFRDEIGGNPHQVLEIKASEFHQDSSLRPVRQMLELTLNRYDRSFASNSSEVLNNWIGSFNTLNEDTAPILHHLLDIPGDASIVQNLDGAALKIRTISTLMDLLATVSVEAPLLLIIDDAQWLDASTAEFLDHLVSQIANFSALVLIAARPVFIPGWSQKQDIVKINIERLDPGQAHDLITRISKGIRLPENIREALLEHADGIPLYIEELTQSVIEASEPTHGYNKKAEISVPTSLQDSLMARLDRLGPTKLIAQKAAVIGRILDRKPLLAISQMDHTNAEQGILELLSCDMLIPRSDIREGMFEFRHALIHDIAYQSLLIRRRKEIHGHVAAALLNLYPSIDESEPEAVAFHYSQADMPDKALRFWISAGDIAKARWANTEAIEHYKRALAALTESAPDDIEQEVNLLLDMTECMRIVDRNEEALEALDRAESLANIRHDEPLLIRIYYQRGNLSFVTGDYENCVALHTRIRDLARKNGVAADEARAESGLGDSGSLSGHIQTAERHFNICIEIARREDLPDVEVSNLSLRGHMRIYLNQFAEAIVDCREAVKLAVVVGNRRAEMVARGSCLAKLLYELGEWDNADSELVRALEIAKSLGARRYIPMYLCFRAKIAMATDDGAAALEFASSAVELNHQGGLLFSAPMTLSTLARTVTDRAEADSYLAKGEAMLDQGSMSQNHFWYRLDAMELGLKRIDAQMVEHHALALSRYIADEPPAWAQFHIRRCCLLSKVATGFPLETAKPEILELIAEASSRNQTPAVASLRKVL